MTIKIDIMFLHTELNKETDSRLTSFIFYKRTNIYKLYDNIIIVNITKLKDNAY